MKASYIVYDADSGQELSTISGRAVSRAFEFGDSYVSLNPGKDYFVTDAKTGKFISRNKAVDNDEEIWRFANRELGGRF